MSLPSFSKAESVGAKTVIGPDPLNASTRPAACAAARSVPNEPAAAAVSTIVMETGRLSVVPSP